jgi:hypothetical protein
MGAGLTCCPLHGVGLPLDRCWHFMHCFVVVLQSSFVRAYGCSKHVNCLIIRRLLAASFGIQGYFLLTRFAQP